MASYGKKMLGLANRLRKPMDDVTNRVTPTAGPSNDKYSLSHMMNFLTNVKTPAELRMLGEKMQRRKR